MQTFLPYADFRRSAEVLDAARLGKPRVETLQILRALELFDYGWGNHPAVTMWRGHTPALVCYGLAFVDVWTREGRADTTAPMIAEFAPDVADRSQSELTAEGLMPPWLGDERLHRSHRSALLRKDPDFYAAEFGDTPDELPYFWPGPPVTATRVETSGRRVWVIRPTSPDQYAEFR
ncbi:MSMEG_6728 family protein [Gordonia jinghuaiqii]|uniref:MSMEG_6728 family protein n=1 Tax=Gordonia jinghuaiqii TaxID=2758710 RepID=A0A7D7QY58_9ACTN|nr:MSMEG_6728 family protein [Gordonia jinghuaiqii]QMT02169.1 MSMEG_6728 family protein [Gordonia jinghuaiqii]